MRPYARSFAETQLNGPMSLRNNLSQNPLDLGGGPPQMAGGRASQRMRPKTRTPAEDGGGFQERIKQTN